MIWQDNRDGVALTFPVVIRSEEHTSELQSRLHLVCRLLLEKKKTKYRLCVSVFLISFRFAAGSDHMLNHPHSHAVTYVPVFFMLFGHITSSHTRPIASLLH